MGKKILPAISAVLAALLTTAAAAETIYVSPTGDDANPGTQDKPIHTLTHARDLIRKLNANMSADITVSLAGGTYTLGEPFELTPADSGTNNHNVIYTAAPDATVVLSGGLPITGWKQIDAAKNIWSAPAPDSLTNTRSLYINGRRATRTRGPIPVKLTQNSSGYSTDSPTLSKWKNPADMEFIYNGGNRLWSDDEEALGGWTEPRCPIASISADAITMAQPCWNNSTRRVMLPASSGFKRTANLVGPASIGKQPTWLENAYELLGTPGQFYFDRPAKTIYYVPRPGEDLATAEVIAPQLEKLIDAEGTAERPVHNIIFSGIQFSYATWLFPSSPEGFSEIQACYMVTGKNGYATQGLGNLVPGGEQPYGNWTKTPGNVIVHYGQNIQFTNDIFTHLGAAGLELGDGSQNDLVQGCVFTDISANGLELGGVDKPDATGNDQTASNKIIDNHFYNTSVEFHGGVAIDVGYAKDSLIAHNQLDHLPYSGISMGWGGWPDKIDQPGVPNFSQNNVVEDNLIFHHMLINADGGAIYTQGLTGPNLDNGEKIRGNVIYDQYNTGHAVYTDNGCKNVSILGNVMFHTNFDNWGTGHKDYYDNHEGKVIDSTNVIGNYWQQGGNDSRPNVTMQDNQLINSLDQVPPQILQSAGLEPSFKSLLTRQIEKPTAPQPPYRLAVFLGHDQSDFACVSFSPSLDDGGSPITEYTVHASTGEFVNTTEDELWRTGYIVMPFSKPGPRSFTITAKNAVGESVASLSSPELTPSHAASEKPGEPTALKTYVSSTAVSIHFQSPKNAGSSPVTAFIATLNPGNRRVPLEGRKFISLAGAHTTFDVIDGLDPGTTYELSLTAQNADGEGPAATTKFTTADAPGK